MRANMCMLHAPAITGWTLCETDWAAVGVGRDMRVSHCAARVPSPHRTVLVTL